MNKTKLVAMLNRNDINGVGVVVTYKDGSKHHFFYEDFDGDKGIDRAARHFDDLINKGYVNKAEYIYKEPDLVHFWDWDTKKDSFCANDEFLLYNRSHGYTDYFYTLEAMHVNINNIEYKYDYTPAIDGISAIKMIPVK